MNAALPLVVRRVALWEKTFRLVWTASPRYSTAWALLLAIQGLLPATIVYLTKLVVDSFVAAVKAGGAWEQTRSALIVTIIMAVVMLLSGVLQSVVEWISAAQAELIQDHVKHVTHEKSASVDMVLYDSPEYHDRLEQASSDSANRPLAFLQSTGSLLQNAITLLAMAAMLLQYSVWLPLILLISTMPALLMVLRFDRVYHKWWKATSADRRWIYYYDLMLSNGEAAPEMRMFSLSRPFQEAYRRLRHRLRSERLSQLRKQIGAKLAANIVGMVVSGAAMVWMGWRAINGVLSIGDLALFYQALNRGQGMMRSLLASIGQIYKNSLFLETLFEFLNLELVVQEPSNPLPVPKNLKHGIEFRNVTFRYPGSQKPAVENFSLFIPAGRIVMMVGENGAGKTTLVKLLCRFYDPDSGSIELDGIDIRKFSVKDLRRLITITFQRGLNYHAKVGESIAMGDLASDPSISEIEEAARNAGAHEFITHLPQGYETLLGKVHANGMELSGGQWQRIAMARAYLRKSPIMLLDEPTSFLDSWSEADWFQRLRRLAKGRTALVITHRFTIAMRADIIHVMHDGQIVESGSHDKLVEQDGWYAKSWRLQMQASAMADNKSDELPRIHEYVLQEVTTEM
jgi:ATP-binding cassette subfamily B protein